MPQVHAPEEAWSNFRKTVVELFPGEWGALSREVGKALAGHVAKLRRDSGR